MSSKVQERGPLSSQKSMKTPNTTQDGQVPIFQPTQVSLQQQEDLRNAISGLGVEQKEMAKVIPVLIPTWGTWTDENKNDFMEQLKREYLRFLRVVELRLMPSWDKDRERDARLIKDALSDPKYNKSYNVLIEIACTRSPKEFSEVQSIYQSRYQRSIDEDIYPEAPLEEIENDPRYRAQIFDRMLVFALVSSSRGPKVDENTAKSEADILRNCFKLSNPMEKEAVVRILSTRSKEHLKSLFNHYKAKYLPGSRKTIDEDLDVSVPESLKQAVLCLSAPRTYFIRILDAAMKPNATEDAIEAFIRVIATRADVREITDEYQTEYGRSLEKDIDRIAKGNFKDFLLAMLKEKKEEKLPTIINLSTST